MVMCFNSRAICYTHTHYLVTVKCKQSRGKRLQLMTTATLANLG